MIHGRKPILLWMVFSSFQVKNVYTNGVRRGNFVVIEGNIIDGGNAIPSFDSISILLVELPLHSPVTETLLY
jgi:hypothetical protein